MKNFTSAARLTVLVLSATGILTGCKPADAPQFSPTPGTYSQPQLVTMSTPTFGATIVYTDDGSAPSCVKQHRHYLHATRAVQKRHGAARDGVFADPRREPHHHAAPTSSSRRKRSPRPRSRPPPARTSARSQSPSRRPPPMRPSSSRPTASPPPAPIGTTYSGAIEVAQSVTLNAIALQDRRDRQRRDHGGLCDHAAGRRPGVRPRARRIHQRATRHADFRDSRRHVPLHHGRLDPTCATGTSYGDPIAIANSLTLKAVACAAGFSDSLVTSGGYDIDITVPPVESVWHSIDFNNGTGARRGHDDHE